MLTCLASRLARDESRRTRYPTTGRGAYVPPISPRASRAMLRKLHDKRDRAISLGALIFACAFAIAATFSAPTHAPSHHFTCAGQTPDGRIFRECYSFND